jgi:hypothetical protein
MGSDIAFAVFGIVAGILMLTFTDEFMRWQERQWTWRFWGRISGSESFRKRTNQLLGIFWLGWGIWLIGTVVF